MFKGVDHVGIGVSDMDKALAFYGEVLAFDQVMFDYCGVLPGMENVTGRSGMKARVVMLKKRNMGAVGLGTIKLVQLLPPNKADPCTVAGSSLWGDIGIAETCFNTRGGVAKLFAQMVDKGVKAVLTPAPGCFPPYQVRSTYAYVRDPDNGLLEFVDWENWKSIGEEAGVEGVNHVGFGVSDTEKTLKFYRRLGFTELVLDSCGALHSMATMFPPSPPKVKLAIIANYYGAWIETIELLPPYRPTPSRKSWGHLGTMEFAIGVTNLERAYEELVRDGIKFHCPPQTVEVSSGQWKYAYVVAPDNVHMALVEPRY